MIPGFSTLNEEDQMMLKTKLGTTEKSGKKRKATGAGKQQLNKKMKEEKAQMTDDQKKEETALKVFLNSYQQMKKFVLATNTVVHSIV